jgi:hypothetical protein
MLVSMAQEVEHKLWFIGVVVVFVFVAYTLKGRK